MPPQTPPRHLVCRVPLEPAQLRVLRELKADHDAVLLQLCIAEDVEVGG